MGMDARARLLRIVLPAALPEIMVGCRTGLVLALITMVTSEMIARQAGVGNLLFNSLDMAQYETVYAMIVIIGVLGFVLDALFERLRARAGRLGRAGARDRGGLGMTARAASRELVDRHRCRSLLLLALWHALAAFGVAPPRCCRRPARCSRG